MATTTAKAFNQFASNLMLTDAQKNMVASRKNTIKKTLDAAFPVPGNLSILKTDLIGSAKRDTIIRPPDDIDLLAVFYREDWPNWASDSQQFLYRVKRALDEGGAKLVGSKGQAVRISYTDGIKVDVAPVFPAGYGSYYLPKGDGSWMQTKPDAHNEYSASKNQALSHRMKPFVRKLKAWNRAHGLRLKSFHLEVMVGQLFSSIGTDSRAASELFFRNAESYLDVTDPSGHSGNLAGGFSYARRQEIIRSFRSAHDRAQKAIAYEGLGDHAEAIRLWRIIYGKTHFPSYG